MALKKEKLLGAFKGILPDLSGRELDPVRFALERLSEIDSGFRGMAGNVMAASTWR
jgi:hypothetical protein